MARNTVLILEDDSWRIERFIREIAAIDDALLVHCWPNAFEMIAEIGPHLADACIISLDHDLYPPNGETHDPGDGLDVARHLASMPPCCPVVVHSSNADRARMMTGELDLGGWQCERVLPLGDQWIEEDWAQRVRRMVMNSHR